MGPNGMNKMLINRLNKMFVTSDCATILSELEVEHPAAKLLVMAAMMQEREIGDGSNFVIILAGELLARAEELLKMGLHPSEIVSGYTKAGKQVLKLLENKELVVENYDGAALRDPENLKRAVFAAISSKQYGQEALLSKLVVDACLAVLPENPYNFIVDNVRVIKVLGGSLEQSEVIRGIALQRDTEGTI